jgi:hypothetical protein
MADKESLQITRSRRNRTNLNEFTKQVNFSPIVYLSLFHGTADYGTGS